MKLGNIFPSVSSCHFSLPDIDIISSHRDLMTQLSSLIQSCKFSRSFHLCRGAFLLLHYLVLFCPSHSTPCPDCLMIFSGKFIYQLSFSICICGWFTFIFPLTGIIHSVHVIAIIIISVDILSLPESPYIDPSDVYTSSSNSSI